jgi:hypothetical protein
MMAHEISWLVPNKVINMYVNGDMTLESLTAFSDDVIQHIEASDAPLVHLLIDERDMGGFPSQIKRVLDSAQFLRHPRLGWFVIYGTDNKVLKFISYMVAQVAHIRHRRFVTQAEALAFLQTIDSTLPNLREIKS